MIIAEAKITFSKRSIVKTRPWLVRIDDRNRALTQLPPKRISVAASALNEAERSGGTTRDQHDDASSSTATYDTDAEACTPSNSDLSPEAQHAAGGHFS